MWRESGDGPSRKLPSGQRGLSLADSALTGGEVRYCLTNDVFKVSD
jgi:hypothetical protein